MEEENTFRSEPDRLVRLGRNVLCGVEIIDVRDQRRTIGSGSGGKEMANTDTHDPLHGNERRPQRPASRGHLYTLFYSSERASGSVEAEGSFLIRQTSSAPQQPVPSATPVDPAAGGEQDSDRNDPDDEAPIPHTDSPTSLPASPSPARTFSKDSEGYPSWLPKRPPPPAPASTFQSSIAGPAPLTPPSPYTTVPMPAAVQYSGSSSSGAVPIVDRPEVLYAQAASPGGGRRQTPRSVRIVSLQDDYGYTDTATRREPTDQTRVPSRSWYGPSGAGALSRGTAPTPTLFNNSLRAGAPRFRARGLHLHILRNPSLASHVSFWLFRLFVFAHVPLQTFFDFNAVFVFIQASKFPTPSAGPGSSRNWALGAAAYIACWALWIFGVCILYDLVYSFARRWRTKRPLIYPLYISAPAHSLVSVSSYTHFCFFQHIRLAAFQASLREGLAESCYFLSQNWPTVALLLPRGALTLAALFSFWSPSPSPLGSAAQRDSTFFRPDGSLTDYARGVLLANAAWVAWRALVLLLSTLGLWVLSGHGCAGLCGPRFRWEEEDMLERKARSSVYSDDLQHGDERDELPWDWRECTRARVAEAFELCLSQKRRSTAMLEKQEAENILAAIGGRRDERRGVKDIFALDNEGGEGIGIVERTDTPPELSAIIPRVVERQREEERRGKIREDHGPLLNLPYPFTAPGAAYSSDDQVPFPPSPAPHDDEEDEEDIDEGGEGDDEARLGESEEPSSNEPRTSGSMSSLGQPVSSRYPFQLRRPARATGTGTVSSSSGATNSHSHSGSQSISRVSQSTGNVESSDSPRSHYTSNDSQHSPPSRLTPYSTRSRGSRASQGTHRTSSSDPQASPIPYPPRHPRARSGTVPAPTRSVGSSEPSSPSPPPSIHFPRTGVDQDITEAFGAPRRRARTPGGTGTEGSVDEHGQEGDDIEERPDEEEEEDGDRVGLLSDSNGPSPRPSLTGLNLRRRASTLSRPRGSSGSNSRTNSHTGSSSSRSRAASLSLPPSVRSRAQSLMHNIGAASRSSLELVRSRANSMARLEESLSEGYHSRTSSSDANPSSQENWTFGYPMRPQAPHAGDIERVDEESERGPSEEQSREEGPSSAQPVAGEGALERRGRHERDETDRTVTGPPAPASSSLRVPAPVSPRQEESRSRSSDRSTEHTESIADISTANPSFVTAPPTAQGSTTESSGGHSWGTVSHMPADPTGRPQPPL